MRLGRQSRAGRSRPPEPRQRAALPRQTPPTYAYRAQRADRTDTPERRSPSAVVKRSRLLSFKFWFRRSGTLIAAVIILICLISMLDLSTQPRIVFVGTDAGHAFHSTDTYQAAVAKQLGSSFWNRNKITVNTGASAAALKKAFPELSSVTVTLPLIGHRPIYYLTANAPALVFQSAGGTYVLDSSGKALLSAATVSAGSLAKLPVVIDQTGLQVQLGSRVLSDQDVLFIRTIVQTLAAKQVQVTSFTLPAGGAHEIDAHLAGQSYIVKFLIDSSSARQQAGTYLAVAHDLAEQHVTPAQYIDVRVAGRAYYQ